MKGCIFSIEEFSVYDGPGIRTTVFLKGCPLRCSWCHNPEGQSYNPQIVRSPNGCVGCNACINAAEYQNGQPIFTEQSIKKCPMNLLRLCGEEIESDALCEKLMKNSVILNNGGGVTFSGGEPLAQSDFVFECLDKLSGKVHRAIQTSGFCNENIFDIAIDKADYFLYDLKIWDDELHKKYIGVSNQQIKKNFISLAKCGKEFTVRIPLIPTVTDTTDNIIEIARFLKENMVSYVELLPYNTMAGGKYKMVQREYNPMFDESIAVNIHEEIFNQYDIKIKLL